jgi:pimeloyl-ACP methyl ester carboxylesterase
VPSRSSSMRDYLDNRRRQGEPRLGPGDVVTAPTAVAVSRTCSFPRANRPREWAERLYNVRRWSVMPRGGHFAPAEEPQLVARDLAAFFATLGR